MRSCPAVTESPMNDDVWLDGCSSEPPFAKVARYFGGLSEIGA